MKKTLIASAVAAATLSTGVMAADNGVEIYGDIEVAYTNTENGANVTTNGFDDNGSTIGFKHSHQISEGVTAFAKVEFEFQADDTGKDLDGAGAGGNSVLGGLNDTDEVYVGVKGDFGSIQYGVDDTVVEWADMIDTSENTGLEGEIAADVEAENIQYVSPEIADGLVVGVTLPVESDSVFAGALAAKYSMDNLEVALAYSMGREEAGAEAGDTIALGATYSMDDITVIGQYEMRSEGASGANDDVDYIGLQGMYTMGQNQFALGYQMKSFGAPASEDESGIALQALHNASDNMYVYLEYTTMSDVGGTNGNDLDTLALGATYSF